MKAKVYRGTKEIGGTCVELIADNGKILWIDLGSPLDDKNPNIEYTKNKVDALLISHPHQDHFGLMESVGNDVPIYIGNLSLDLIAATKLFIGKEPLKCNFQTIKPWEKVTILDTFQVTPFLTDHSTPESFAFLIEVDGKKVYYSGDFRATGRKNIVYQRTIEKPPKNIDLLLIEGTMVERINHIYQTEKSIEEGISEVIKDQSNASFVISSAQNIDRLVSVYNACKRKQKTLVIDIYTAWLLEMVRKHSKSIPTVDWDQIKVYLHPSQLDKITDKEYDEFRFKVKQNKIGKEIFNTPEDFVYFVRCPNENLVNEIKHKGKINIIYSQWEGYLKKEFEMYSTAYLNQLKNDDSFTFQQIHTSGHATVSDLMKFAKAMNSDKIIPIHTAYPEKFKIEFEKEGFDNIHLWEDGNEYKI